MISKRTLSVVILAAGKGSRMLSALPKALHLLSGKAIVQHVIDTSSQLENIRIHLVYGCDSELLRKKITCKNSIILNWVFQAEQKGTGHAVKQALPNLYDNENVLVLYGDVPFISLNTLHRLLSVCPDGGIGLLTAVLENPEGYGRILRINGEVTGVIEQKDANEQQKKIKEINTGIFVTRVDNLKRWLGKITNNNMQGEFYLTEIIAIAWREGRKIKTIIPRRNSEIEGINNRLQLARLERFSQREKAENLLLAGVMLSDPDRFDLRGELWHKQDVFIDTNVILEGRVILGNRVKISTGCVLKNVVIGDDVVINPYTVIEGGCIAARSTLGPFCHLRPGSKLEEDVHVGNFVEIKKTCLGKRSKVGHFSYLGDTEVGSDVNIGAGTITCNYDGANKNKTFISDNVFIGSGTQLVAPVTIGHKATIGAGTTVTCDVNDGETVISRIRQFSITNWKRPIKKK